MNFKISVKKFLDECPGHNALCYSYAFREALLAKIFLSKIFQDDLQSDTNFRTVVKLVYFATFAH